MRKGHARSAAVVAIAAVACAARVARVVEKLPQHAKKRRPSAAVDGKRCGGGLCMDERSRAVCMPGPAFERWRSHLFVEDERRGPRPTQASAGQAAAAQRPGQRLAARRSWLLRTHNARLTMHTVPHVHALTVIARLVDTQTHLQGPAVPPLIATQLAACAQLKVVVPPSRHP